MAFDYSKLRGKIIEKYGSQQAFAATLGISEVAFSRKLNCKNRFSTDDILAMISLLDIPNNEIGEYFFQEKV